MSGSAEALVSIQLLSSVARVDGALDVGAIIDVRADVAAAWIADGLAVRVQGQALPETTMRESGRARKAPR